MMNSTEMLPFTFEISASDSPQYVLNRLAALHGYLDSESMIKASNLRISRKQEGRLLEYEHVVRTLTGQIVKWKESDGFEYNKARYFKVLATDSCNLCIDCHKENKSPFYHRYVTSSHCLEHNCKLINRCHCCDSLVEISEMTNNGCCSFCAAKFVVDYSSIPNYQKHLSTLPNKDVSNFVHDLCMAAGFILRPYDSKPRQINPNQIRDWGQLFTQAYALLTCETLAYKWFLNNSRDRALNLPNLGTDGSLAGYNYFLHARVFDWSTNTFENEEKKAEHSMLELEQSIEVDSTHFASIRPRSLREMTADSFNEYSRYQVEPCQLSYVLGLNPITVQSLMKNNVLIRCAKTNAYVHNHFDLREIDTLIEEHTQKCGYLSRIPLDELPESIDKYIGFFGESTVFILSLVFSKSNLCMIDKSKSKLNGKIYCRKLPLLKHLMSHFKKYDEHIFIESEALEKFGLSQYDLRELKKNDILHPQPFNHRHVYYKSRHLQQIDKSLFNVGRYCKLRNLNFAEMSIQLAEVGIMPIIGKSIFQCRYQVIRFFKFKEVVDPINTYDKPLKFCPFTRRDPRKAKLLYN